MLETIAVLAVFFVLVILGFSVYSKFSNVNLEDFNEESLQLDVIKVAQRVSSLPELQCSLSGIVVEGCIDMLKLEAISGVISKEENKLFFFDNFGFSRIIVKEIYPDSEEVLIYDNSLEDYSSKTVMNVPISLFDSIESKYSFAAINIEVFSKS